jgi:hypothetical protein
MRVIKMNVKNNISEKKINCFQFSLILFYDSKFIVTRRFICFSWILFSKNYSLFDNKQIKKVIILQERYLD